MRVLTVEEGQRIRQVGQRLRPSDLKVGMEVQYDPVGWKITARVVAVDGNFAWLEYLAYNAKTHENDILSRRSITWSQEDIRTGFWDSYHLRAIPPTWDKGVTYKFRAHHRDAGVQFTVTAVDEQGNALAKAQAADSRTYFMGLALEDRKDYEPVIEPDVDPEAEE